MMFIRNSLESMEHIILALKHSATTSHWGEVQEKQRQADESPTSLLKAPSLENTLSHDKCSGTLDVSTYKGPGGPRRLTDS